MIDLAIADLLNGLYSLHTDPICGNEFEWVAMDSSFIVDFKFLPDGKLEISNDGAKLCSAGWNEVYCGVMAGVIRFVERFGITEDAYIRRDFTAALARIENLINRG